MNSDCKLTAQLYDSRDFSFAIVNFPYLHVCSNTPVSPAYGVYISQLIRYARECSASAQFTNRGRLLTNRFILQECEMSRLKAAFREFLGCYNDLVYHSNLSMEQMLSGVFHTNCQTVIDLLIQTAASSVYLIKTKVTRRA